ncbi:hypothetical protein [Pleionea mediterranea]|uniref:SWIM-type domain-containing protein n=1 Tax=Pleionea mediterranea TaxID=523701 RepID=A0A316FVZ8_9GAMM|nr:hypothetical protein [Pleionea mediterranea]PWK51780.1 hypothetical protein C8D97_10595 [Pleionea mediterranea]
MDKFIPTGSCHPDIALWLDSLTEEYIVTWANKGLVRRGKKLLTKQQVDQWKITENEVSAQIDGFTQKLSEDGFHGLSCSCAATELCHHLTCFLAGLLTFDWSQYLDSTEEAGEPWIISDKKALIDSLSSAAIERAIRWLQAGIKFDIELTDKALTATVYDNIDCEVYIPKTQSLASATCSCKKAKCEHIALVVLVQNGNQDVSGNDFHENSLSPEQLKTLQRSLLWLNELIVHGLSGMSKLHIQQASALATELKQSNFPVPSKMLTRLTQFLEEELNGQLISNTKRIRKAILPLHLHLNALTQTRLPQPLKDLAGEHKSLYIRYPKLWLDYVSCTLWETASGYHGYSIYFYSEEHDSYFSLSDARDINMQPGWRARYALQELQIGEYQLQNLKGKNIQFSNIWLNKDNRLSLRADTQIESTREFSISQKLSEQNTESQIMHWMKHKKQNVFASDFTRFAIIPVGAIENLEFDQYEHRWESFFQSQDSRLKLIIPADGYGNRTKTMLSRYPNPQGLFGQWITENDQLCFYPLSVINNRKIHSLTVI